MTNKWFLYVILAGLMFALSAGAVTRGDIPWQLESAGTVQEQTEDTQEAAPQYAKGYIRVSSATMGGWLPLPDEEDYVFPLRQTLMDGTEAVNLIHVTPEGYYMEASTCQNQDCVHQGEVTLSNREMRALGNMVICLPNQVYLELFSIEEILAAMEAVQDGASD